MDHSVVGRIEVEYTECTKEWLRMWARSIEEADALRIQLEETLETIFGLELSVQLFEVERSGYLVIVRWFYVPDVREALASVVEAEISYKAIRLTATGDEEAHYLANYLKRTMCVALYDVSKFGCNVFVDGKPFTMTVPYDIVDWHMGGEVLIERVEEFELSFNLIERVERLLLDDMRWNKQQEFTSWAFIEHCLVQATHTALVMQAEALVGREYHLFADLPLSPAYGA